MSDYTHTITNIIRVTKTRYPELDPATFASVDGGESWYGVPNDATIGDEIQIGGDGFIPISCTRSWIALLMYDDHGRVEGSELVEE